MKWLNEKTGVIANCEQTEPVLENEMMVSGYLCENGSFKRDPDGPDILHQPAPGQVCVEDDDPRILELMSGPTPEELVERDMNSPLVLAVLTAVDTDGKTATRISAALKQTYSEMGEKSV